MVAGRDGGGGERERERVRVCVCVYLEQWDLREFVFGVILSLSFVYYKVNI